MVEKAKKHFMGAEFLNCAQAVAKAYMEEYATVDSQKVRSYAAFGGGMAPEGLCGAVFAAKDVVADPVMASEIVNKFQERVGSVKCMEIRPAGKVSCSGCVGTAAQVLVELKTIEQKVESVG